MSQTKRPRDPAWQDQFETLARLFGTSPDILVMSILASPNARGYVAGSLSEVLLRRTLEERGYHLERIKEKWVGPKLHHGDFYVSRDSKKWYVLESKGLKSNAERWAGQADKRLSGPALVKYFNGLRDGERHDWWQSLPTERRKRILASEKFHEARILETHFVSGTGGRAQRQIATPRKSEFHGVAIDLFLRTGRHEFAFASSHLLASPSKYPDHLKQNYLIDIVVPPDDLAPQLRRPWTRDFDSVFATWRKPVRNEEKQVDNRAPGLREGEELAPDVEELT